jgi:uncharacterized membrane protein YfhO
MNARRLRTSGLLLYVVICLIMMAALALYYILKHKAFAFVDIGSDLFFQFYPLQLAEARELRQLHELTWSFEIGLGAYIGSDFDPIQTLAVFFPESWQLAVRLPIYFFKLLLGGAFFLAYLRRIGFNPMLAVIGALGYTFSSYSMVNGQWDPNAAVSVQLAAYLFFLEAYLRGATRWSAVAAGLTVGLGLAFDIYTFSLLTVLYLAARTILGAAVADRAHWQTLARYVAWAAMGFALTAPMQLPNLYYFFDNPRVSGNYSALASLFAKVLQINDRATLGAEVAGLFGKDLLGTADAYRGWANYFEGPGFYVGMLLLLCIPQLLAPASTRREKVLCATGLALLVAYFIWPALRYLVYGFGHVVFRVSTLWVSAALIVLGLMGLRRALEKGPWRPGLVIGACAILASLAIVALSLPQVVNVAQILRVAGFTLAYVMMLWVFSTRRSRALAATILVPVVACELLLFSAPAMLDRTPVGSDGNSQQGSYNDGTVPALAQIRQLEGDQDFYRIEKTYNSVFLCDALVQQYSGIKSYFFHGSSISRFVDSVGIERLMPGSPNYIGSGVNRPAVLDLVGVKYLLARDHRLDATPQFEHVTDVGGISIYRNLDNLGFAHLHTALLGEDEADKLPVDQRNEAMRTSVVVANPDFVRRELEVLDANPRAGSVTATYSAVRRLSDIDLAGDISAPTAAVLLVSMPFDRGWSARLDDAVVPTFAADYGLTALLVPPGLHQLRLTYRPPGRALGNWLALASLGLLLFPTITRKLRIARAASHAA